MTFVVYRKSIILQNGKHTERSFAWKKIGHDSGRIAGILQRLRRIGKTNQHQMFYRRKSKCEFLSQISPQNALGKSKSGKFVSLRFETEEEKRIVILKKFFAPTLKGEIS